jgi:hypothetical protein
VLFPTACLHIMTMPDMDPLLAEAICRAYNHWLDDFCQENPQASLRRRAASASRCFACRARSTPR